MALGSGVRWWGAVVSESNRQTDIKRERDAAQRQVKHQQQEDDDHRAWLSRRSSSSSSWDPERGKERERKSNKNEVIGRGSVSAVKNRKASSSSHGISHAESSWTIITLYKPYPSSLRERRWGTGKVSCGWEGRRSCLMMRGMIVILMKRIMNLSFVDFLRVQTVNLGINTWRWGWRVDGIRIIIIISRRRMLMMMMEDEGGFPLSLFYFITSGFLSLLWWCGGKYSREKRREMIGKREVAKYITLSRRK